MDVLDKRKKDGTMDWLLEESAPSVRCETLVSLLGKREDAAEVIKAKAAVMHTGMVPAILERMHAEEYASTLKKFYHNKYRGPVWQLIILAELHADGENETVKEQCEYILSHSQEEGGGFSVEASAKGGRAQKRSHTLPYREHGLEPDTPRVFAG